MKRTFYKYKKINEYLYDMLENHYFYLTNPHQLNDEMEGVINTNIKNTSDLEISDFLKKKGYTLSVEEFRSRMLYKRLKLNKYIDKSGICSFTVLKNNELMWKEYGDNNLGVVLGFEADSYYDSFLFRVKSHDDWNGIMNKDKQEEYGRTFPDAPKGEHVALIRVKYNKTEIPNSNFFDKKQELEACRQAFLTKTNYWSKEQEYRIVLSANKENPDRKLYYEKNILKEIIFGKKTLLAEKNKIKNILSDLNIKYST